MKQKKEKTPTLTPGQIRFLKSLAHHLKPVVQIGKEDLSENIISTIDRELANHELIKVKIGNNSGVAKQEAADVLPQMTGSVLVQLIGKTIVLYRGNKKIPRDRRIKLPK